MVCSKDDKVRCFGNGVGKEFYADYHDNEWGIPKHDDQQLFEMLILEGAQAGLSWETILRKREGYRAAFHGFDPAKVAAMTDEELQACLQNPEIVRNKLKVFAARKNAIAFLKIQQEFGSFDAYIWAYVDGRPIKNHWPDFESLPASTEVSEAISKDLKKRGMTFVGPTIMYAFMQSIGMVDDHLMTCWKY
ncbi:MAG: DNA-3-methyladenine glycosylase I [Proteobacteria bacterium]|nr:MAG: DNA-3-methyladenine glycosylase I [Pseudomonadota bacterium]